MIKLIPGQNKLPPFKTTALLTGEILRLLKSPQIAQFGGKCDQGNNFPKRARKLLSQGNETSTSSLSLQHISQETWIKQANSKLSLE